MLNSVRRIIKKCLHSGSDNHGEAWWLGKRCEDCGDERCKELGVLPKGCDCALWKDSSYSENLNRSDTSKLNYVERKKGKWISRDGRDDCFECSECHVVIEGDEVYWRNNYFCYHCGADMRGE